MTNFDHRQQNYRWKKLESNKKKQCLFVFYFFISFSLQAFRQIIFTSLTIHTPFRLSSKENDKSSDITAHVEFWKPPLLFLWLVNTKGLIPIVAHCLHKITVER